MPGYHDATGQDQDPAADHGGRQAFVKDDPTDHACPQHTAVFDCRHRRGAGVTKRRDYARGAKRDGDSSGCVKTYLPHIKTNPRRVE